MILNLILNKKYLSYKNSHLHSIINGSVQNYQNQEFIPHQQPALSDIIAIPGTNLLEIKINKTKNYKINNH